jgi:hypothetical protein
MIKSSKSVLSKFVSPSIQKEGAIRLIKIIDITFITILYSIAALLTAMMLDIYIYKYISLKKNVKDEDKETYIIFFEIVICLIINTISAYFIRNILQLIPFPLAGYYGFKHLDVYEVSRAPIVDVALILFSKILTDKITVLQSKLV